ncbi:MAG: hypothetical protein AABW58_01185 [Nanoarchaeota archaeon]
MKKCLICEKGTLVEVDDIISEIESYFFIEKGKRCTNCSEEFLDEKTSQKTIEIARRLGIWGEPLKLHRKLSRSERGTLLRIPADLEQNLNLKGDEKVLISKIGKNKILVEVEK